VSKTLRLHAGKTTTVGYRLSNRGLALLRRALGKHHRELVAQIALQANAVVPTGGLPVAARNLVTSFVVTR
jgi:hypothetical protein